ncbi:MAG: hypothetical protein WCW66_01605 [Patescibacteria group bacterium]|jgi:Tfp pilus assembly protein PilO
MKLTPKIKLLIISILGIAAVFLIINFTVIPQQKKIISLGNDIYDQRVNYEFITQQRHDLVRLERQIKEIGSNNDLVSSSLFSQQDTLELITILENVAKKYEISDQLLNLSNPVVQESGLYMSTLNIAFNTSYSNIINWTKSIEQEPFYLLIDSVSLSSQKTSQATQSEQISIQISARVYWQ